jgi:hypothetical protein
MTSELQPSYREPTTGPLPAFSTDVVTGEQFDPIAYLEVVDTHFVPKVTERGVSFSGLGFHDQLVGDRGTMFDEHELAEMYAHERLSATHPELSVEQLDKILTSIGHLSRASAIVETAGEGFVRYGN